MLNNHLILQIFFIVLLQIFIPERQYAAAAEILPGCEIVIDDFADGISPGWKKKSYKGTTEYTWTKENNVGCIKATSQGSASSMYYRIKYDPKHYPYITWRWKVDNILKGGDATRKSCDDYSARFYVVFPSLTFWKSKAINYIWANKLPEEEVIPNSYTGNSIMISVESGEKKTGKWITETRNVYEDFKRVFGKEPPKVGAIAIMTDTDNTGESAAASYGAISVCSKDPQK